MPLNTERIQGICFDVDGTLSDTDDIWLEKLLPIPGFSKNFARRLVMALETPGNYLYHLLDRMGMDAFAGRIYNWINRSLPHRTKKYRLVPGTIQTLEVLGQRFPMAVVSAGASSGTHGFLETFGLRSHFKAVATSQTCQHTKPYPDPVIWAAAQMGIEPRFCLMVGDTVVDIHAGKAAGAQTVGVLCGFGEENELRQAGADLILASPLELLAYLAQPAD